MAWRFGGVDPSQLARPGESAPAPIPPEPWPSRVEAFVTACAMHAGQREHDLMSIVEGFGKGVEDAQAKRR